MTKQAELGNLLQKAYGPVYGADIEFGIWYAQKSPLTDAGKAGTGPLGLRNWQLQVPRDSMDSQTGLPRYWCSESELLRRHMKGVIHDRQAKGKFKKAEFMNGVVRTREDFGKFGVRYDYDRECQFPQSDDVCKKLGETPVDDTVRIKHVDTHRRVIWVQKATYVDQVASNVHADVPFSDELRESVGGASDFRTLDRDGAEPRPFEACLQANTIGVACVLVDSANIPILTSRNPNLLTIGGGLHCSSSGVLQWQDVDPHNHARPSVDGIFRGMEREIEEELQLQPDEYTLDAICLARELPRAGKPQFFFIGKVNRSTRDIMDLLTARVGGATGAWERVTNDPSRLVRALRRVGGGIHQRTTKGVLIDESMALPKLACLSPRDFAKRLAAFTYEGRAALKFASDVMCKGK